MAKSPDAFRTISEVAEWLDVPAHVLRFWESRFTQIRPVKRAGGRRYYRPADMELLGGIKQLLHDDGLTIRGVQKLLREEGVRRVASMSPPLEVSSETIGGAGGDLIETLGGATQDPGCDVDAPEDIAGTYSDKIAAEAPMEETPTAPGDKAPMVIAALARQPRARLAALAPVLAPLQARALALAAEMDRRGDG